MPPPAEGIAARLVLGPALRAQPDRRLVTLVREGYEAAFEEIVRRYGKPLRGYAASIVGIHAEDVTQDAFSKALLALRRDGAEIELRPWLYRIVRNTALNDLRDRPPAPEAIAEAIAGGRDVAEEAEQREQLAELIGRLRALPEPQRVAIVMRELEGLSHEEIAGALGLSGGAARQAIYRARQALRDGLGMLVPAPLLRWLIASGGPAGAEAAAGAAGVGGAAGLALKATAATVLVAGAVGAGVALKQSPRTEAAAIPTTADAGSHRPDPSQSPKGDGRAGQRDGVNASPSHDGRQGGVAGARGEGPAAGAADHGGDSGDRPGAHHTSGPQTESSGHRDASGDGHHEPGERSGSVEDGSGDGGELGSTDDGLSGNSGPGGEEGPHGGSDAESASGEDVIPESGPGPEGDESTLPDGEPSAVEPPA